MAIATPSTARAQAATSATAPAHATQTTLKADCCIVGGGPAGMVLALLLARQGIDVVLLEAHETFDREFRGDTVHPSTLELFDQLGLVDRLLEMPQARGNDFPIHFPDGRVTPPNTERPRSRFSETLIVPQVDVLELLAEASRDYPSCHVIKGARVEQLIKEDGQVRGVRYRTRDGWQTVRADLVVGADGRFSKVRQLAGLSIVKSAQAMDVLWLRLPRAAADPPRAYGLYPGNGDFLVIGDRGDTWLVGFAFPKGSYQHFRQAGIESVRQRVSELAPWLADRTVLLQDWSQTSLLNVEAGRVQRWYRPGLLLIGDAAHVMSPVFGVGINYAIQDAIVAANKLGPRLRRGKVRQCDLAAVQRRREWPTRLMQFFQHVEQRMEMAGLPARGVHWTSRLVALAPMRWLRARLIAFGGLSPERVREPRPDQSGFAARLAAALGAVVVQTVDSDWIIYTGFHWWSPGAVIVPIKRVSSAWDEAQSSDLERGAASSTELPGS
jgi:2-polyprenyl-6-methoxyphenol hydroxylase-like FAD-dependent oxidoreductase